MPSDLYIFKKIHPESALLSINGEDVPYHFENGYAVVNRRWESGDELDLNLPMPVRRVVSHPSVVENENRIAFQRGPLVYCAEEVDNGDVFNLLLHADDNWEAVFQPDLLNGVTVIRGHSRLAGKSVPVTLIPYYSWAHRGAGKMAVWLSQN